MATALEATFIKYRILLVFISLSSHLLIDIAPTARMSPSSQENGMRNEDADENLSRIIAIWK